MDEGEVQILKGAALTVTDRRIIALSAEIPIAPTLAPQLEAKTIIVPVRTTFLALASVFLGLGLIGAKFLFWFTSAVLFGAAVWAKVKRQGFEVSVETAGGRKAVYATASEKDAQLALAALYEALRRAPA